MYMYMYIYVISESSSDKAELLMEAILHNIIASPKIFVIIGSCGDHHGTVSLHTCIIIGTRTSCLKYPLNLKFTGLPYSQIIVVRASHNLYMKDGKY